MKKRLLLTGIMLLFGITVLFLACSKSSYNSSSNNGGGGTPANTISMKGSVYSIPSLTVTVGSKVTWVNDDNMIHTVTADNGSFDSGDINPGYNFSYTFNSVGTFNYHCIHHSSMIGVVIVAN